MSSEVTGTTRKGVRSAPKSVKKVVASVAGSAVVDESGSSIALESEVNEIEVERLDGSGEKPKTPARRRTSPKKASPKKASPKRSPPVGPQHPLVEAADDLARRYLEAHPKETRATLAQLRAYYLWHKYEFEPAKAAPLLRIEKNSVITYALSVIKYEDLPYDEHRLLKQLAEPLYHEHPFLRHIFPLAVEAVEKEEQRLRRTS